MSPVSNEILNFVSACDAVLDRLERRHTLTHEERYIIVSSCTELLDKMKAS